MFAFQSGSGDGARFWQSLGQGCLLASVLLTATVSHAAEWPQFRTGGGVVTEAPADFPLTWKTGESVRWEATLPGKGSSSPIVWGSAVFVTCYSGYGTSETGQPAALQRHLLRLDLEDGQVVWDRVIPGTTPEDTYEGFLTEHGFASSTPVTDGEHVFAFFGKAGVFCFDFDGQQVWHTSVGQESSNRRWGSAASPVLYQDLVLINAAEESQSLRALRKVDGSEAWKSEASTLELCYATPAIVTVDSVDQLVLPVPGEVWGFNPRTGALDWFATTPLTGNVSPSPIVDGNRVFLFGGFRSSGSLAVRCGGKDDVTATHIDWTSRNSSYVATPVLFGGHLYWVDDRGTAWCVDANSGQQVYRERLNGLSSGGRPVYASPVVMGDKLYVVSRFDGTFVLPAKPEFQVLAQNKFDGDVSDFNATPAIANGSLLIRSDRKLYCVGR